MQAILQIDNTIIQLMKLYNLRMIYPLLLILLENINTD